LISFSSIHAQGLFKTYPQATANFSYFGNDIIKTADGNFLILSYISSYDTSRIAFHGNFAGYALTKVTSLGYTSTFEIDQLTGIKIFPNPTKDFFNIELEEIENDLQFTMIDITGRIILQKAITKSKTTINTGDLLSGMYFYKITANNGKTKSGKLLIQP
jgi:hypothetical protein